MTHEPYFSRRQTLLAAIGDGVAIVPTAPERIRNRDSHYPYRFDSYFWHLTGFPEPEAALVLIGGDAPRSILFCRAKNEEREVWDGFRHGPDAAREAFGFDEAHAFDLLEKMLPELIAGRPALWYALGYDAAWDARVIAALNGVRAQTRAGKRAPEQIHDPRALLDRMRLIKDTHELDVMRRAAAIASAGHLRAMQACRPGLAEYELEAELSREFRRRGADGHAFPPIVAGGGNACVLHYVGNDKPLADRSLVLIDAGCELGGYAADITRTFPVNGKFSGPQRDVYQLVLAAQAAAIAAIRPGAPFVAYHDAALRVLVQGLADFGLLSGNIDGLIESEAYQPFYMHRTGHWLGLDVHDAGDYKTGEEWIALASGMTLTVEPGLYLRPGPNIPEPLRGIGIRIEDDVIVTADGAEVYTSAPRTIAEIEEVMLHDRRVP
ncbi:MAG: aminopeptidase P N-terminal domain-containing protein [Candidatus Accumulibacter sp.]|jgi:Xaa-Pro aminopeptidase|nr:aminopeptidase P N-terminal domain-containing protein [Accumulibacter sp.]